MHISLWRKTHAACYTPADSTLNSIMFGFPVVARSGVDIS